jgi:hypothetical protein
MNGVIKVPCHGSMTCELGRRPIRNDSNWFDAEGISIQA